MVWELHLTGDGGPAQTTANAAIQGLSTLRCCSRSAVDANNRIVESLLKLVGLGLVCPRTSVPYVVSKGRYRFQSLTRAQPDRCTCFTTDRHQSWRAKASWNAASIPHNMASMCCRAMDAFLWNYSVSVSSARDFDRQVAEIQIRTAILNGFTALAYTAHP